MPIAALLLLLLAAVLHATWNFYAKGARNTLAFTFAFVTASVVAYLPIAAIAYAISRPDIGLAGIGFIAVSGLLHILYYFMLTRGYRVGDLSLVYPLARGTGPMLAVIGAIVLFDERPTALAVSGACLIGAGILVMSWTPKIGSGRAIGLSVAFALATGACTAVYTLWDNQGVERVPPVLYSYGLDVVRTVYFAPFALRTVHSRRDVVSAWREQRRALLAIALLSPLAYLLVLVALTLADVSYVAPAREISILFGALIGLRLLGEADAARRLIGAAAIVAGIFALALG